MAAHFLQNGNTLEAPPWARRLTVALLMTFAAVAYARALEGPFQFDDYGTIPKLFAFEDLLGYLPRFLTEQYTALGRPITDLVFAVEYRVFGLSPWAFHCVGLALHLAAIPLAYAVVRRVARSAGWPGDGLALFVAGVFALHPMQTQAVSYVSQLSEVLASALYLTALLLMLEADERRLRGMGVAAWLAAFGSFVLAIGAKPIAVTLPAVYLLITVCLPSEGSGIDARRSWPRRLLLALPFAIVSAALALRPAASLRGQTHAGFDIPGLGPAVYFMTQWRVVLGYLRLLAWPSGQNVDHELAASQGLLDPPSTLLAGLTLAALVAAAITIIARSRRRHGRGAAAARLAGLGLFWFLLLLAPTSTIVPLADLSEEHRVYLALLGVALAAGASAVWALGRIAGKRAPAALGTASAIVLVSLTVASCSRNDVWTSTEALWADAAAKSPGKGRPHDNYAQALYLAGKVPQAVAEYRQALDRHAYGTAAWVSVIGRLGGALLDLGRVDEATELLRNGLDVAPADPELRNHLAICYFRKGDLPRARELAGEVVQRSPNYPDAHGTMGEILLREGDMRGALAHFQRRETLLPDKALFAMRLAVFEQRIGMIAQACSAWTTYADVSRSITGQACARERKATLECR